MSRIAKKKDKVSTNRKHLYYFKVVVFLFLVYFIPTFMDMISKFFGHSIIPFVIIFNRIHILLFVMLVLFFFINDKELYSMDSSGRYKEKYIAISSCLLFFTVFYILKYKRILVFGTEDVVFIIVSIFYIMASTALFCSLFSISYFVELVTKYRNTLSASIIVLFLYWQIKKIFVAGASFFSGLVAKMAAFIAGIFYDSVLLSGVTLSIKDFSVRMSIDCSGADSFPLFFFLSSLVYFYDKSIEWDWKKYLLFFVFLPGTLVITALRVFLIVSFGADVSQFYATNIFHNNIGWLLFIVYFLGFYTLLRKMK